MGSHEVSRAKVMSSLKPAEWHPLVPFHHYISHKAAKSMAKLISQSLWWITAGCVLVKRICSHVKVTRALVDVWQASETSHSKSNLGNFQHQYLPKLLVNVCSCRLMMKSVSWCCVHGRWLFSNLVTFLVLRY